MSDQVSWTLADWLSWQETLHPQAIAMGLERVQELARRLSLPDHRIRTLIIAGTNGKGSSATLAAGIYRAAGYHVGLYTSPHLLRYNERVAINGEHANDADLCRAFRAIEQARETVQLTYFEFGTLAALWLFREAQVDVQVLEVGLGGRLDAVNIVDANCALITNIGLDHTDWLGMDRESIAAEKAGIIRACKPVVYADESPTNTIPERAQKLKATLIQLHQDFDYQGTQEVWQWCGLGIEYADLPLPGLKGSTQLRNAAGVIAAIEAMQNILPITEAAIRAALPQFQLAGRFQRLGQVILDVAHNAEAALVLADNLVAEKITGRIFLVLAMFSDKPVETFARILAPCVQQIFVAGLPSSRGLSGIALAQRLRESGLECRANVDVSAAFRAAREQAKADDVIVVTGSFLTVAAVAGILNG